MLNREAVSIHPPVYRCPLQSRGPVNILMGCTYRMRYCCVLMIPCSSPIFTFLKFALLLALVAQEVNC
jgi:hypothetical protein